MSNISDQIEHHGSLEAYLVYLDSFSQAEPSASEASNVKTFHIAPFYAGETFNWAGSSCKVTEELFWVLVAIQLKEISGGKAHDHVVDEALARTRKYIEVSKFPFTIGRLNFQIKSKKI